MPNIKGAEKLSLVKRIRDIRELLSIATADSRTADLSIDPADKAKSLVSLTDYLKSDINKLPEPLRDAESEAIRSIEKLMTKFPGENPYVPDFHGALSGFRGDSGVARLAIFDHFKSSAKAFDVDVSQLKDIQNEIDRIQKEPIVESQEITQKKAEIEKAIAEQTNKFSEIIDQKRDLVKSNDPMAPQLFEELVKQQERIKALYEELRDQYNLVHKQPYLDRKNQIAEMRSQFAAPGQKIINALLDASPITQQQAEEWANKQHIDKSVFTRLKKSTGYTEEAMRRDMAEFHRIIGGKLRTIDIVTDGSKRPNAGNIGHYEFNEVRIDSNFNKEILWHELAHHLEADSAAKMAANGFLLKRRESDTVYSLRSVTGNKGFRPNEGVYKDEFIDAYIGKVYRDGATEVFSMGVQYLSDPEKAVSFLIKDPEMFSLIAGYLQSDLSPAMKAFQKLQNKAANLAQDKRDDFETRYQ